MDFAGRPELDRVLGHLAAIVDSSDDAIISKTLDGRITSWNAGAERIFGYSAEEAVGQPITMIIPPERQAEEVDILSRLRCGEHIDHFETIRVTKDGRKIEISLTVSPVRDGQGQIIGASKIARDITLKRQAERELQQAWDAAKAANRSKDRFLAVVSHELRNPLQTIAMTLTALQAHPDVTPTVRQYISIIQRNVELEARLVEDLLDLSRMVTGNLSMEMETVPLNSLLSEICETFRPCALQKDIQLLCVLDKDVGLVKADSVRLRQVFGNLLQNSLKFTPPRGNISVRLEPGCRDAPFVAIRDTGAGLEPEVLSRIFEPFETGNSPSRARHGGLGLGLAICKYIIEAHGGRIRAHSDGPGKGSEFVVELPKNSNDSQNIAIGS